MLAASVRGPSNQVLSEVLRAGRASTARLSPLSTPDSILMCYQKSSRGRDEQRRGLCYDKHHVWAVDPSIGRLVRQTLSHSKKSSFLRRHLALEDAVFNFVRPHQALRIAIPQPTLGRKWQQRTPAMAAELTDHIWSLEELLSYRVPPPKD